MTKLDAERDIKRKIDKHGWTLLVVSGQPGPNWVYTIGLVESFKHPEIVIVGLGEEPASILLNVVAEQVRDGRRFSPDARTDGVCEAPFVCGFKEVPSAAFPVFLGSACRYYRDPGRLTCLQMFVADRNNRLPWEAGADPESKRWQVDISIVADLANRAVTASRQ